MASDADDGRHLDPSVAVTSHQATFSGPLANVTRRFGGDGARLAAA